MRLRVNPGLQRTHEFSWDPMLGKVTPLSAFDKHILNQFQVARDLEELLTPLSWFRRLRTRKRIQTLERENLLFSEETLRTYENLPISSVDLELTGHCQADCPICPRDEMPRPKQHMTEEVFAAVVKAISPYRSTVFLSGLGDCLLHPKFLPHLETLRKARIPVRMVTNGNRLDETMRREILRIGVEHVSISVQSVHEDTYRTTMRLPFRETIQRVEQFAQEAKHRIPVTICFVETKQNAHERSAFLQYWKERNVSAQIFPVHHRGGWMTDRNVADPAPENPSTNGFSRCALFNSRIFIAATGDILPCCHDMTAAEPLGHVLTHSLSEIRVSKMKRITVGHLYEMCMTCDDASRNHEIRLGD